MRWAQEMIGKRGVTDDAAVIGAVIDLGNCFDLTDEATTALLRPAYDRFAASYAGEGKSLPTNKGPDDDRKFRKLDCLVINDGLDRLAGAGIIFQTARSPFHEGPQAFPGSMFRAETHIQVAVRDPSCIRGIFRPQL